MIQDPLAGRLGDGNTSRLALLARGVQPHHPFWVGPDDGVVVGIRNSLAGVQVAVEGRLWLPDGSIDTVSFQVSPPSDRSLNFTTKQLHYGYLVSLTAQATGATLPRRGQTYVTLGLIRPPTSSFRLQRVMGADYVSGSTSVGWPDERIVGATEGAGALYSFAVTTPALGADWSATVPTGARWLVHGVFASLTTSNSAGNRTPGLFFDDGTNIFAVVQSPVTQGASIGNSWTWVPGYPSTGVLTNTTYHLPLPYPVPVLAGGRVRVSTTNLANNDQWSGIRMDVEEWLED